MCARLVGSASSSSSVADTECMNSSNFGRRYNWFPNPNDLNSKSGFIRTPLQRSGSDVSSSGLSKRQFVNQRKRRGYRHSRSTVEQECQQSDEGFNPFRLPSENLKSSLVGAGSAASFSGTSNLEEGSSHSFIFKGLHPSRLNSNEISCSDIADAVAGMKINHDRSSCETSHGIGGLKQGNGLNDTGIVFNCGLEMHNLSKDVSKLNIKSGDDAEQLKKASNLDLNTRLGFEKHGSSYGSFPVKTEEQELQDQLKKLELRDSKNSRSYNLRPDSSNYGNTLFEGGKNKESFVKPGFHKSLIVNASHDGVHLGRVNDNSEVMQPPEMNRLKINSNTCLGENKNEFHEPPLGVFTMNEGLPYKPGLYGVASTIPNEKTEYLQSETSNDVGSSFVDGLFHPQLFHKDHEMESRVSKSEETSSFVTNHHMEFSTKTTGKYSNSKYRRDLRSNRKSFSRKENTYSAKEKSAESPTPMDISPIQEMTDDNKWLSEAPTTLRECEVVQNICVEIGSQSSISEQEIAADLISETQSLHIVGKGEPLIDEIQKESSDKKYNDIVFEECPPEESLSGCETESFVSANDRLEISSETSFFSTETEVSSDLKNSMGDAESKAQCSSNEDPDCAQSSPSSNSETSPFVFSANTYNKLQQSSHTYDYKKKNRPKSHALPVSDTKFNDKVFPKCSLQRTSSSSPSFSHALKKTQFTYRQKDSRLNSEGEFKEEVANNSDQWRMCEEWRLRGNTAYSDGNMLKAEEFYTEGVNCISPGETSGRSLRSMMLCYSNRAATRMTRGRIREALEDCMVAVKIDPTFRRVQVRAANCYLALGEIEQASEYFRKCLHSTNDFSFDDKIAMEASDGLRKAEKVADCMNRSTDLLNSKMPNDAEIALCLIVEALLVSTHSERLLEMKANSLFRLQKYGDVIHLCEQNLNFAKENTLKVGIHENIESAKTVEHPKHSDISILSSSHIWSVSLYLKSHFLMGRLEEALQFAEKQGLSINRTISEESLHSRGLFYENNSEESIISLLDIIRQLLHHKNSGNEAFRAGRHMEAVEHYTTALSFSVQSGPFAAICFCNRAAACKALGQITDAISDCNIAVSLNANYLKALSRRAELFEKIRDYEQSYSDLARILFFLSERPDGKNSNCRTFDNQNFYAGDIKQIRLHLSEVEEFRRKEIPLDMYQILGVEQTASVADIRKAYRKAALRHHPDKAAQFLAKNESTCGENWTEIANEVQKDADRLFKMIGEAYAILSDPVKRSQYNEDERRQYEKKDVEMNMSRTHVNEPFPMYNDRRQQWRDAWKSNWTSYSTTATGATRWPY